MPEVLRSLHDCSADHASKSRNRRHWHVHTQVYYHLTHLVSKMHPLHHLTGNSSHNKRYPRHADIRSDPEYLPYLPGSNFHPGSGTHAYPHLSVPVCNRESSSRLPRSFPDLHIPDRTHDCKNAFRSNVLRQRSACNTAVLPYHHCKQQRMLPSHCFPSTHPRVLRCMYLVHHRKSSILSVHCSTSVPVHHWLLPSSPLHRPWFCLNHRHCLSELRAHLPNPFQDLHTPSAHSSSSPSIHRSVRCLY